MQRTKLAIMLVLASCQAGGGFGFPPAAKPTSQDTAAPAASGDNTLITMPNVNGLGRADAEAAIRKAGLRGKINVMLNDGAASTEVCRQVPSMGGKTAAHFNVDIELCRPEAPPAKPLELAGLSVSAATAKARASGFDGEVEVRVPIAFVAGCKDDTVCTFDINQDNKLLLYLNKKMTAITTPE